MFDLRNEDDIIRDINQLNNICQNYNNYKSLVSALMAKYGIESASKCDCIDYTTNKTLQERLNCKKCGGIGFTFKYKDSTKEEKDNGKI